MSAGRRSRYTLRLARRGFAYAVRTGDFGALGFLPRWVRSVERGRSPVDDGRPWVTFRAQDWLDEHVRSGMEVREFGSGGSTVYFARRGCVLRSVEHDRDWHELVKASVPGDAAGRLELNLREPEGDSADEGHGAEGYGSQRLEGRFEGYASVFDDDAEGSVDMAFIDGRARNACARHAVGKVKPGGWIVLDNAERARYRPTYELLSGWELVKLPGPGPYVRRPWLTVAFRKPGG